MSEQKIQDDITIVLKTQKIIVHETVRVNVSISAAVDPSEYEGQFRTELHSTLRKFINTDWKIQSIQRTKGASKYENVYVQATARVAENENYQLYDRAADISRVGFEVLNPTVDYSLTFDEIQQVNQELRQNLFKAALTECSQYNTSMKEAGFGGSKASLQYRVSSSRFDNGDNAHFNNATIPLNAMMASAAVGSPKGGGAAGNNSLGTYMGEDDERDSSSQDLNVSTRFAMTGTFVLRAIHV